MIWIGLFIVGALSYCKTDCYVNCLQAKSLNKCSEECCKFDNISFDDGKVYFHDKNQKIEIELEEIFYPMPQKTEYVAKTPETKAKSTKNPYDSLKNLIPGTPCQQKCVRYCRTRYDTCYTDCNSERCEPKAVPAAPNYALYIVLAIVGLYIIKRIFTPQKYLDGYFKLD
jgi:hypothetical protein